MVSAASRNSFCAARPVCAMSSSKEVGASAWVGCSAIRRGVTRAASSADPSEAGGKDQVGGRDRRHFVPKIDAVHRTTADAHLVVCGAAVEAAALARITRLEGVTARAGIHPRDQHEAGR
jgi:hypothetical protein